MFNNKDKIIYLLSGIILGIFATLFFLGVAYVGYKVGAKALRAMKPEHVKAVRKITNTQGKVNSFKMGFESGKDKEFFEFKDGLYAELSADHTTEGRNALFMEFPQGAATPGLFWEMCGLTKCMNWSDNDALRLDLYNPNSVAVDLVVRLKSNPDYPKTTFEKTIPLPAGKWTTAEVTIAEMERGGLDTTTISYMKFYVFKPNKDIVLYIDNIRLTKNNRTGLFIDTAYANPTIGDFDIGTETTLKKVFQKDFKNTGGGPAQISSAANEYEGIQIVFYNIKKDLENVSIDVSDLISEDGANRITKDNIKTFVVNYVNTKKPWYPVKLVGLWPDPLVEASVVGLKKGKIQPIWIEVQVPKDAIAGNYCGTITIKADNHPSVNVKLQLKVWDFNLPGTFNLKTAFDLYPNYIENEYPRQKAENYLAWKLRLEQTKEKYYLNMLSHRISPIFNIDPLSSDFDTKILTYLDKGLNCFAIGSHTGSHGSNWPKQDSELGALLPLYKGYADTLKQKGLLNRAYLYTWDEGEIGNPQVQKVCRMVHEADPELKNMVCYHGLWDPDKLPGWGEDIDIWCFQIAYYDEEKRQKLEEMGKEIWMYVSGPLASYPNLALDFPAIDPRIIPWMCWKYDIKGFLYWCVNYWTVNPWKETMNTPWQQNCNGVLYYPGTDGPVASLRLKIMRDGLEDYEYLYLLNEKIIEAEQRGLGLLYPELIENSKKLLEIDNSVVTSLSKYTKEPNKILDRREEVAQMIESLAKLINEQEFGLEE